ncbi:hypothetical protein [Cohnella fermenti]|uniref:Uncharacterized protein n=1 Tax=Cohnella fermenti TaxID=2565925 RepID=A0A4S4BHX7_9BACL|nr:hypothetical protein [Cohnella fermenti]THF73133.1 hypothetical protein E6C55_30505 [Cohnella fermenti]
MNVKNHIKSQKSGTKVGGLRGSAPGRQEREGERKGTRVQENKRARGRERRIEGKRKEIKRKEIGRKREGAGKRGEGEGVASNLDFTVILPS